MPTLIAFEPLVLRTTFILYEYVDILYVDDGVSVRYHKRKEPVEQVSFSFFQINILLPWRNNSPHQNQITDLTDLHLFYKQAITIHLLCSKIVFSIL
jgi:hypothetical protein